MKARKLKKTRGKIRYWKDVHGDRLWRWQTGRMTVCTGEGWNQSSRLPHSDYGNTWVEIKPWQARRQFPNFFNPMMGLAGLDEDNQQNQ